jgi:hypothetical protein
LTDARNALNRSAGQHDTYRFVRCTTLARTLVFVHDRVTRP